MASKPTTIAVATDVVLFSIHRDRLEVLLTDRGDGFWGLPGGRLGVDEDLQASALRVLEEKTGVRGVYLEQLYTFGRPDRDPRRRMISVAYYALVPLPELGLRPLAPEDSLGWFPVKDLPPLVFDHSEIVALAQRRLSAKLAYSTIALKFMPERFSLGALQKVYETILGEALDKRNFRKRVLALGCIEATGEVSREGNHRPARLYRVKNPDQIEFFK